MRREAFALLPNRGRCCIIIFVVALLILFLDRKHMVRANRDANSHSKRENLFLFLSLFLSPPLSFSLSLPLSPPDYLQQTPRLHTDFNRIKPSRSARGTVEK